jgi:hypothetical protein
MKKNKNKENRLTTIYTQNAQGLWHHPRDPEGNILVDQPPDLLKLEYLIDYMRQDDVRAWLIQEICEEGNDFDVKVGGYHIFRHNKTRRESGCQHLLKVLPSFFHHYSMQHGKMQDPHLPLPRRTFLQAA